MAGYLGAAVLQSDFTWEQKSGMPIESYNAKFKIDKKNTSAAKQRIDDTRLATALEKIESLKTKNTTLTLEISNLTDYSKNLISQVFELTNANETLKTQLSDTNETSKSQISELTDTNETLKAQISILTNTNEHFSTLNKAIILNEKLANFETQVNEFESHLKKLNENIQGSLEDLQKESVKYNELLNKYKKYARKIREINNISNAINMKFSPDIEKIKTSMDSCRNQFPNIDHTIYYLQNPNAWKSLRYQGQQVRQSPLDKDFSIELPEAKLKINEEVKEASSV